MGMETSEGFSGDMMGSLWEHDRCPVGMGCVEVNEGTWQGEVVPVGTGRWQGPSEDRTACGDVAGPTTSLSGGGTCRVPVGTLPVCVGTRWGPFGTCQSPSARWVLTGEGSALREREEPGVCDSGHPKPQPLRGSTVKEFRVVLRLPGLLVAPCWGPGWTLAQGRVGSGLCGEMAWAGIPIEGCHGLGDPRSKGEREFVFGRKLWD